MRLALILGTALLAAADPPPAAALDLDEARHLLTRTGFGAAPAELKAARGRDRAAAVKALLDGARTAARTPPPPAALEEPAAPGMMRMMPQFLRVSMRQEMRQKGGDLKAWWYAEMLSTPSPLTERMTLFWHNHFTSSLKKTKFPPVMYRQNQLLRRHALGSFKRMLFEVAKDPAMVIYLDSARNKAGKPNENFAREVMELFTLGEGHYTEKDIKEAARAFTGWSVDRGRGEFRYRRNLHDYGVKTVLGVTGELGGEDVLEILLKQPACAENLTRKAWREFVSEDPPPPAELARLAAVLRDGGYQIRPWLEAILLSEAFWDPAVRGTLVKSPAQLLVGTVRSLGIPPPDVAVLAKASARLGQDLFDPPNVKGWPGGKRWITSTTLLRRDQLLRRAIRGMQGNPRVRELAARPRDELITTLLAAAPVNPLPRKRAGWPLLRDLLLDPAYQLY